MIEQAVKRAGFVALIGATNVGKSTLVNALVGSKISIVTPRPQTTRNRILGIFQHQNSQILLMDTPGFFTPKRRLDRAMIKSAWDGAQSSDLFMLMVDGGKLAHDQAKGYDLDDTTNAIMDDIEKRMPSIKSANQTGQKQGILIINKIDLCQRQWLLKLVDTLNQHYPFAASFMISALKQDGLDALKDYLANALPISPWLFPDDQLSDMTDRQLAAEITREKLFLRLHQELPYGMTVETEKFEERKDGSIMIHQTIYIARKNHKAIILGKNGQQIKEIGQAARYELSRLLNANIHIKLFVKHRENWQNDPERYRALNIEFDS